MSFLTQSFAVRPRSRIVWLVKFARRPRWRHGAVLTCVLVLGATFTTSTPTTASTKGCDAQFLVFRDRVDAKAALAAVERRVRALKVGARALGQNCRISFNRTGNQLDIGLPKVTSSVRRSIIAGNVLEIRAVLADVDPSAKTKPVGVVLTDSSGVASYVVGPVRLTGNIVTRATTVVDQASGRWSVDVALTKPAAKTFDALANEFFGKRLAIVVDGRVSVAPTINARKFGGRFAISGNLTAEDAKSLVDVLQSGYPESLVFEKETIYR